MVEVGRLNTLPIIRETRAGLYLDGGVLGEILLPGASRAEQDGAGTRLSVFLYHGADGELVASQKKPLVMVGEFAWLRVAEVNQVGAFLDWGLPKDLMLPFAEQKFEPQVGRRVMVRVYLDNSGRIAASTRLDRFLAEENLSFKAGQSVSLLVADRTELGFKVIVDHTHWGMLYSNELFQNIAKGEAHQGFIKRIRPDKKIDATLYKPGHERVPDIAEQIIATLKQHDGYIMITDKSPPEAIYAIFKVSKKVYKRAVGALYKQRRIVIEDKGIRLKSE